MKKLLIFLLVVLLGSCTSFTCPTYAQPFNTKSVYNTMELLTKEIEAKFAKVGYQGDKSVEEINVICKWFNPMGAGTWYAYERLDDDVFMCFANLDDPDMAELGTVSIGELRSLELPFGMGIERDRSFRPIKLSDVIDKIKSGGHV